MAPVGVVASTVTSAGAEVKTGAVVSCTRTTNVPVVRSPALSVAEAVTVVSPMAKVLPLAGTTLTLKGATSPASLI